MPAVGDVALIATGGIFGHVIKLAQLLAGYKDWRYNHAAIVVDTSGGLIEASPRGVRRNNMRAYSNTKIVQLHMLPADGERAASLAVSLIGKPYGWVDIAALAISILGYKPAWVRRACLSTNTLVCSQLAAFAAEAGGVTRWGDPFWVVPAELSE